MTPAQQNSTSQSSLSPDFQSAGRIAFEKLPNTRDLGYLTLASGHRVASRKLIRSGALAEASGDDVRTLNDVIKVKTIIDLRTVDEREKNPDPEDRMAEALFVSAPILGYSATGVTREDGVAEVAKKIAFLKTDPKQLMIDLYPKMLLDETGIKGFTSFFKILADTDEGAILWHCAAGKDRAGLASVLVLTVLGVSQDAIVSDYLATNQFRAGKIDDLKELLSSQHLTEDMLRGLQVLNSADEAFLAAAIMGVEKEYGSLDGYIKEALGVDNSMKETLRHKYLDTSFAY